MCSRPASYVQPRPRSAVLLLVMLGCTRVSDNQRFPPTDDEIAIVQTVPSAGAEDVPPDAQLDLCLSDFVDPRSITDTDATISSGAAVFDSRLSVQLLPWRDPGGSAIPTDLEAPWCSGSVLSVVPRSDFVEGVRFRLRLRANAVGWAGESLDVNTPGWVEDDEGEPSYFLEFVVGDALDPTPDPTPDEEPMPDDGPTLTDLFAEGRIFDPERGTCSCHQTPGETANALLDLSTPERAFDELLLPSRLRDTGFPMVTPRRPSESFLLHKLLRDGDDEDGDQALHGVLGSPMPPDESLPYADFVDVARWIDAGANP